MSEKVQNEHGLEPCEEKGEGKGRSQVSKMVGLHREGQLGEGQLSLSAEKFRIRGRVYQPYLVTGKD